MESVGSPGLWAGFIAFVVAMLALDLGVFHRKAHVIGAREALSWSLVWIGLALVFNLGVWWRFGAERGIQFLTGYLIEKSLSIDNIFVFVVIFTSLGIPALYQHRVINKNRQVALGHELPVRRHDIHAILSLPVRIPFGPADNLG